MRSYFAEFFGTAFLLAVVAGSGVMGETLSNGNAALALLANSIATGAGLYVLIVLLGPISGAHFNPVVSLMFWKLGHIHLKRLISYWACQFSGAITGIWLTHLMFGLPLLQESSKARTGLGIWASELISTLVLLSVIRIGDQGSKDKVPMLVALTVTAGYWFTSSTFFANPAVAVARSMSNTFVGIAPADIPGFLIAEMIAGVIIITFFCKNLQQSR
jgi:glycerol uptake facilitator-like aquaporin